MFLGSDRDLTSLCRLRVHSVLCFTPLAKYLGCKANEAVAALHLGQLQAMVTGNNSRDGGMIAERVH